MTISIRKTVDWLLLGAIENRESSKSVPACILSQYCLQKNRIRSSMHSRHGMWNVHGISSEMLRNHRWISNKRGFNFLSRIARFDKHAFSLQNGSLLNCSTCRFRILKRHKSIATISSVTNLNHLQFCILHWKMHLNAVSATKNGSKCRKGFFNVRRLNTKRQTSNEDAIASLRL